MADKFEGFVKCLRSYRIRIYGEDLEAIGGRTYRITNRRFYDKLVNFRVQVGSRMVLCFEKGTKAEWKLQQTALEAGAAAEGDAPPEPPQWDLEVEPEKYLEQWPKGPNAGLAREMIAWRKAQEPDGDGADDE